ncbi:MAG: L-aspartate oxidase, partial [Parvularcula sp.]|nr:L-aspartate oxidase [Parvularcula sp.]
MERIRAKGGVLVVGAGIAGLWTALSLKGRDVTVITAGGLGTGSSSWAQGGLAAAVGADDSPECHFLDTIEAGSGASQPKAVRVLASEGSSAVQALIEIGVPFDRNKAGELQLGREAAHSRHRIVHVGGDEAGAAIMKRLVGAAHEADRIELRDHLVAEHVSTDDQGVTGVTAWDISSQTEVFIEAPIVVLATGGVGGLYAVTTNPLDSQGLGHVMAAEAGATLRDLEFVQFHPTGLDVGRDPAPLATEAIRGEGGLLRDADGVRFMKTLHPDAELAPRDIVARGVAQAIANTGQAFLDVRGSLGRSFAARFTTVYEACRMAGLDPAEDLLPVAPAAHYHMGGIKTDLWGRSDVRGLFAVGECASTGVHGANRLASNSLLEAIVFGSRAAEAILGDTQRAFGPAAPHMFRSPLTHRPARDLTRLRKDMASRAGLLRRGDDLTALRHSLTEDRPASRAGYLARLCADGIAASAIARTESRGTHFRDDFPDTDNDSWMVESV